jgi:hypothetical protein
MMVFSNFLHIITFDLLWKQPPRDVINNKQCKHFCVFLKKYSSTQNSDPSVLQPQLVNSFVEIMYITFVLKHKTIFIHGLDKY